MQFRRLLHGGGLVVVSLCALLMMLGCDQAGAPTNQTDNPALNDRNISAVVLRGADPTQLQPVERVARADYGRIPLGGFVDGNGRPDPDAVPRLFFPSINAAEISALAEGMGFFTTPHVQDPAVTEDADSAAPAILEQFPHLQNLVRRGAGPVNNQLFCMGCHRSARDARAPGNFAIEPTTDDGTFFLTDDDVASGVRGLLSDDSQVARATRATVTNFRWTSLGLDSNAATGGRSADSCDRTGCDAINDTGEGDPFTIFGDFSPSSGQFFDLALFGGGVQHTRPSLPGCFPDFILPFENDPFLFGGVDPATGLSAIGVRRAVGERAGPPYIGRGLMEAILGTDLLQSSMPNSQAIADPDDVATHNSLLLQADEADLGCDADCASGRPNLNNLATLTVGNDPVVRIARFGLRAAGPAIIQFVLGGVQGEVGFTNLNLPNEPANFVNAQNPACEVDNTPDPDIDDEPIFSCRTFVRMTAPPELGANLRDALEQAAALAPTNTTADCAGLDLTDRVQSVLCGALLFGVDPIAFRNRIDPDPGTTPWRTDGRDPNAINRADQALNCVACHVPVQATGTSPAEVGARHLSNKWIHLFSDLLIHDMGEITAERIAPTPRNPLRITRTHVNSRLETVDGEFVTLDLSRNLADDALPTQGVATGREWRTPPLWGMGLSSPPFLHDARVYLSNRTVNGNPNVPLNRQTFGPGGTVFSHGGDANATPPIAAVVNGPLVVRNRDDAIRATIELHDLPMPDSATDIDTDPATAGEQHSAAYQALLDLGGGCPTPDARADVQFFAADLPPRADTASIRYGLIPANPGTIPTLTQVRDAICPSIVGGANGANRSEARITMLRFRRLSPAMQQALINFLKEL